MMVDAQGYREAVALVMAMEPRRLLDYIDSLYGRENLPRSCTVEDIRNEALAQTERHFGPDYERVLTSKKMAFAAALVRNRDEVARSSGGGEDDDFLGLDSLPSTAPG